MKTFPRWIVVALIILAGSRAFPAQAEAQTLPLAEALAAALADAGVQVATHVPATGATEVYDAFCERTGRPKIYSYNEETAHAIAHGAALGGARSVAILKSHGFAKAANSIVDSIVAGNTAGFVVLVFHDPTGGHSDTVLDTTALVAGTKMARIHAGPETACAAIFQAFQTSERLRGPVAVVLDSDDLSRPVAAPREKLPPPAAAYERDVYTHLLCPLLAPYQHRALQARLAGKEPPAGQPALPSIPDGLPPKFKPTAQTYQPVFDAFKKIKGAEAVAAGDAGTSSLFAFPPYDCVDLTTFYGGSIPLACGLYLAGHTNAWAVCGDFAFIAAAHLGLPEALQRQIPLKVIVFHNDIAAATGGQPIQPDVFEHVLGGWRDYVRSVRHDAAPAEIEQVLAEAKASGRLEIIVVEVP